jgi:flagellin
MSSISAGGIGSIQTTKQTEKSQQALKDVFRELASNLATDQVGDDAARLAIAERFNSKLQGVNQATLNVNDGIAVVQVADSGLQQVQGGLYRLQELAIQSANGILTDRDRQNIQGEAAQIQDHIRSVISDTEYNDIDLLTSNDKLSIQVGPDAGDQTGIKLNDFTNALTEVDLSTQAGAERAIVTVMDDLNRVASARNDFAATQTGLSSSISRLSTFSQALSVAGSGIHNADIAEQSSRTISASIRAQANIAIQAQANLSSTRVHQLVQ